MNGNGCPEGHHRDPDSGECVADGPGDDKTRELVRRLGELLVELEEAIGDSPRGRGVLSRLRRGLQELEGPGLVPALQKAISFLEPTVEKVRTYGKLTNSIRSLSPSSTSEDFAEAKGFARQVGAAEIEDRLETFEICAKMLRLRKEYESGRAKGNGDSSAGRDSLQELVRRLRQLRGG